MATQKPIFLFAFANDTAGSLRLGDEERAAREALTAPHISPSVEYMNLGHASLDDIYRTFNRYHNQIALFHYGGHSDDQFLSLTDTYARSSSLSALMGMQENLQLVFLNGCDNNGQVEELQSKGVKAIIATSVKIDDERAIAFCRQFYQAMVAGGDAKKNIQQAFETAKSFLENDGPKGGTADRGIKNIEEKKSGGFEWELFLLKDHSADWSIPGPPQEPEDADFFKEMTLENLDKKNKNLLGLAFGIGASKGILHYRPKLSELTDKFKQDQGGENFENLRDALFDAFPSVLSIQLKDLFTPPGESQGRLRLKEINEAYLTLGRLLNGIALSSLWEAAFDPATLEPRKEFVIREEYKKDIQNFLDPTDPVSAGNYDYFWLISTINRIFLDPKNKEFKPYVPELAGMFQKLDEEAPYYKAYRFLEQNLRGRLIANDIPSGEVEGLCDRSEGHLGLLLQQCAFLSAYQLITVKDVTVYQPRQELKPLFYHNQFILEGQKASNDTNSYTLLDREEAINNNSLYLARDFKQEARPLNLSPFLIDENAFKAKSGVGSPNLPKIHFFSGQEGKESLHYVHAEDPENMAVIHKDTSAGDNEFNSWASNEEKYVVDYFSNRGGKREEIKNPDKQNYKDKDLKILFNQLELFRKALGI